MQTIRENLRNDLETAGVELADYDVDFLAQVVLDLVRVGIVPTTAEELETAMRARLARNREITESILADSEALDELTSRIYHDIRGANM